MDSYAIIEKDRFESFIKLANLALKNLDIAICSREVAEATYEKLNRQYNQRSWGWRLLNDPPYQDLPDEAVLRNLAVEHDTVNFIIKAFAVSSSMRISIADMRIITRWAQ